MTAVRLWDRLHAEGLVEGDYPEPTGMDSPWYVRVMLGIAGWIGALFLLLFVGGAFYFILDNASSALIMGALCCAGAFALFRLFDGNDFAAQFGLAVSLAGQAMIVAGLGQSMQWNDPAFYLAVAATQGILALVVPNPLHRLLASNGTALALALAINQMELHGLAAPLLSAGLTLIWLDPKRWASSGRVWRPIGYGLVFALLLIELFRLFGLQDWLGSIHGRPGWMALHGPLIGRAVTAVILVWVAIVCARREEVGPPGRITLAVAVAALVFGLLSLQAPGLASAVLILLLGFAAGNRILVALGILALLGFVSHFYYSLHATLLEKSGLLAIAGLCLLAVYLALRRFLPAEPREAAHA